MSELFKTYERIKVERLEVAEVTKENIGQIAALIKGQVDYSRDTPAIIAPLSSGRDWRVEVGYQVSVSIGANPGLTNQNGFNRDGNWKEVAV